MEIKDPELETLEKQVRTLEQELQTANENFEKDKEVKRIKRKIAKTWTLIGKLQDKEEKIRRRAAEKYLTNSAYCASYHTVSNGYRHEGNLAPYVVQAIKDVMGPISKLKKTEVEEIVDAIIHKDQERATADVRAERQKLSATHSQWELQLKRLQNELLLPHQRKLGEAREALSEYRALNAPSPKQKLKAFREKATTPEVIEKISQRIDQLIQEQK